MQKSDDCKAQALELLGAGPSLISHKDSRDLWRIAFSTTDLTAKDYYTVNRIRERVTMRGVA